MDNGTLSLLEHFVGQDLGLRGQNLGLRDQFLGLKGQDLSL